MLRNTIDKRRVCSIADPLAPPAQLQGVGGRHDAGTRAAAVPSGTRCSPAVWLWLAESNSSQVYRPNSTPASDMASAPTHSPVQSFGR